MSKEIESPAAGSGATPAPAEAASPSTPSVSQYLNISDYVYYGQSSQNSFPAYLAGDIGYVPLLDGGAPLEILNEKTGLFAEAFISTSTQEPTQVIIGYEGTNLYSYSNTFTSGQIIDDADILAGQNAPSYKASAAFAAKVVGVAQTVYGVGKSSVFVTGHSLGAAEAEYAALQTGLGGATFGTPGIPLATNTKQPTSLTDYVDYGDPVGNYADDGSMIYNTNYDNVPNYKPLLLSTNITHYGTLMNVGSTGNAYDIKKAITDYETGYNDDAAYRFGESIDYHYLSNYASDLGQTLYYTPSSGTSATQPGNDAQLFATLTTGNDVAAACYVAGTRIRTARGDRSIETLQVGDLVEIAGGDLRPIKWLGHRAVECRHHPRPSEVMPVRIAAGAFGPDKPARDLLVSPGHAICVDVMGEVFIPAAALIDAERVAQVEAERVTYWHLELDSHDVILAENLPSESFLDMGNRSFFIQGSAVALAPMPDTPVRADAAFCRPFHASGPIVAAARARLRGRAEHLSGEVRGDSGQPSGRALAARAA